jgi:hypothetical protein
MFLILGEGGIPKILKAPPARLGSTRQTKKYTMCIITDYLNEVIGDYAHRDELVGLFAKSIPTINHYERFMDKEYDVCVNKDIVYNWWNDLCDYCIESKALSKVMKEAMEDTIVIEFLKNILDVYNEYISYDEDTGKWDGIDYE